MLAAEITSLQGTLEQTHIEIASLQEALERTRTDGETAREAGERLARERREISHRPPVAPAVSGPLIWPPSVRLATMPVAEVPSASAPRWSHGAQRAFTASLADASEWRTGLKDALRTLGSEGGWDAAVAWCGDKRANALRCVAMWMSSPDQLGLFETATWQRRQSPAASQVGRVSAGDRAEWLGDLGTVNDAQLSAAAAEGMRTALLVPIRHGGEASGVLELLTRAPVAPSSEIASAMEAVALQLAHFEYLLRRGGEPRWRLGRL